MRESLSWLSICRDIASVNPPSDMPGSEVGSLVPLCAPMVLQRLARVSSAKEIGQISYVSVISGATVNHLKLRLLNTLVDLLIRSPLANFGCC